MLQDTLLYILDNTQGLTSSRICGILFQTHGCSEDEKSLEWTVNVNVGSKPKVNRSDNSRAQAKANY
jgi:hypothetical protein